MKSRFEIPKMLINSVKLTISNGTQFFWICFFFGMICLHFRTLNTFVMLRLFKTNYNNELWLLVIMGDNICKLRNARMIFLWWCDVKWQGCGIDKVIKLLFFLLTLNFLDFANEINEFIFYKRKPKLKKSYRAITKRR